MEGPRRAFWTVDSVPEGPWGCDSAFGLERPWAQVTRRVLVKMELFGCGSLGKMLHDSAWHVMCGGAISEWPGSVLIALFY